MTDTVKSQSDAEPIPKLLRIAAVLTAGAVPFALAMPLPFLPKQSLNLTLYDPLIWFSALALCVVLPQRERSPGRLLLRLWKTAWPGLVFLLIALLSMTQLAEVNGLALRLSGKKLFQLFEYLVLTPFVFAFVLRDRQARDQVFWALSIASVVAVAFIVQTPLERVFSGDIHPNRVGGLLGNRHTYAAYMAMACPLLAGWAGDMKGVSTGRERAYRLGPALFLPFLAVYPMLSAGGLLALLAGMAVAWTVSYRAGVLLPLLLVAWVCWAGGPEGRSARGKILARSMQVFRPFTDPRTGRTERRHTMRYYRWAANLNMVRKNPILGVGIGQYQRSIHNYYGSIPRPEGTTDDSALWDVESNEPLTFSWFFETLAETGLLGWCAALVCIGAMLRAAIGSGPNWSSAGLAGAACALLLLGWWTSPWVRGAGPMFGLVLAASAVCDKRETSR